MTEGEKTIYLRGVSSQVSSEIIVGGYGTIRILLAGIPTRKILRDEDGLAEVDCHGSTTKLAMTG